MRIEGQSGWVLHSRPYRDTSLLVEIFCEQQGRVGLIAKGARGKRGARVELQPFHPLTLSWLRRGDLGTLTNVEFASGATSKPISADAMMAGWYANELMMVLLQRDAPDPTLFEAYCSLMGQFQAASVTQPGKTETAAMTIALALRHFENALLDCLGFGLPLEKVEGGDDEIVAEKQYYFDPNSGATLAGFGDHETVSGAVLIELRAGLISPENENEARRVLRGALQLQLHGRKLKTPQIARSLSSFSARR